MPRRAARTALRRAGALLAILVGAGALLLSLALLAVASAFVGGPALVDLLLALHGR